MKVKIRRKIFDGSKEPVMVILTKADKRNISNMDPNTPVSKYCEFPNSVSEAAARNFMDLNNVDRKTGKANINKKLMNKNLKDLYIAMKSKMPDNEKNKAFLAGWRDCMNYVSKYPQDEGEIV